MLLGCCQKHSRFDVPATSIARLATTPTNQPVMRICAVAKVKSLDFVGMATRSEMNSAVRIQHSTAPGRVRNFVLGFAAAVDPTWPVVEGGNPVAMVFAETVHLAGGEGRIFAWKEAVLRRCRSIEAAGVVEAPYHLEDTHPVDQAVDEVNYQPRSRQSLIMVPQIRSFVDLLQLVGGLEVVAGEVVQAEEGHFLHLAITRAVGIMIVSGLFQSTVRKPRGRLTAGQRKWGVNLPLLQWLTDHRSAKTVPRFDQVRVPFRGYLQTTKPPIRLEELETGLRVGPRKARLSIARRWLLLLWEKTQLPQRVSRVTVWLSGVQKLAGRPGVTLLSRKRHHLLLP
mmetsp:Transcript_5068/g.14209  ORF Transcript_5068/g.14209 Transcript_5068/m.14209 type:complete len:340 (-) Transcript_5068:3771-4790(-)